MSSASSSSRTRPVASSSSLPPVTPRNTNKYRRKSAVPLSTKQYDRMQKQIEHARRVGAGDVDMDMDLELDGENVGEAADVLGSLDLNSDAPADSDGAAALDGQPHVRRTTTTTRNDGSARESEVVTTNEATNHWLERIKRGGVNVGGTSAKRAGQAPDAIGLAAAAAKGLQGRREAPPDSFAHEGSFLFNPLGRRVPHQQKTPRKSAPAPASARHRHHPSSSDVGDNDNDDDDDVDDVDGRVGDQDQDTARAAPPDSPTQSPDLASMPREVQQAAIIEDLLYVLMGIEGQYITFAPGYEPDDAASQLRGATYVVDPALDVPLQDLVLRIVPLSTCYSALSAFVDRDSMLQYGTVTHALCAAIRDMLKEYEELVVQLEHQLATSHFFTLQKLWLYIHPMLHRFTLVYGFVSEVASITHADILESDDDDDDDDDSDGDSDDSDAEAEAAMREARAELEREKRRMMQVDGAGAGDGDGDGQDGQDLIEGGIVKGGEVLSMLWDRVERQSGDPRAHALFLGLFHRAAQPYAKILLTWISTGILTDSYDEFIVFEDPRVTYDSLKTDPSDIYWEQRYTLRDANILAAREREKQSLSDEELRNKEEEERQREQGRGVFTGGAKVPAFLEPWKKKILLAGKYLNVVRECGIDVSGVVGEVEAEAEAEDGESAAQDARGELIIMTDDHFFRRIERAYQRANTQLLHLLLREYHLVDRLRSLKHYFFFSSSDFFSSFVEQAERELRKLVNPMHVRDSVKTRLQTHLGMVLGSSAVVGFTDPYREDVKVGTGLDNPYESLKRIANTKGVKGGADAAEAIALKAKMKARERDYTAILLDVLEFDVTVKFPVSLVISRKNMIRWKFLHTVLIQLKVTERQLADVWLEQQAKHWQSRVHDYPELEGWKMRVFRLRHRMTFFVQNLLGFYTSQIIEPNWAHLERKMDAANTVDTFLRDHTDFLNDCRRECMLTDVRFVEFLGRLMASARTFYENRNRLDDHVLMAASSWSAAKIGGGGGGGGGRGGEGDGDGDGDGEGYGGGAQGRPPPLGTDMWRALEKQETKWSRGIKAFNSVVQLLATTDNPSALPLAMRLQTA